MTRQSFAIGVVLSRATRQEALFWFNWFILDLGGHVWRDVLIIEITGGFYFTRRFWRRSVPLYAENAGFAGISRSQCRPAAATGTPDGATLERSRRTSGAAELEPGTSSNPKTEQGRQTAFEQ